MNLSQILEAKYYRGRISANRVANLYWDAFESKQNDNNFIRFHSPRLYGNNQGSATSTQMDAFLRADRSSQAIRFVKDFIQKRNIPYTSLIVKTYDDDDYVVTITFKED